MLFTKNKSFFQMGIEKNSNNKIGSGFSNYNTTVNEIITDVNYDISTSGLTFTKFGGGSFVIPVQNKLYFTGLTYNDLNVLKNNDLLLVGRMYVLPFKTIHTIPNTNVNHTGNTENLVLEAISSNNFNKRVYSLEYPEDLIEFDFDDNLTEDGLVNRSGKITYRKFQQNNNEACFDFRNVKFRIWSLDINYVPDVNLNYNYTGETIFKYLGQVYYSIFPNITTGSINTLGYLNMDYGSLKSFNSTGFTFGNFILTASTSYTDFYSFNEFACRNVSIKKCLNNDYPIVVLEGGNNNITIDVSKTSKNVYISGGITNVTIKGESNNIQLLNGGGFNSYFNDSKNIIMTNGSSNNYLNKSENIYTRNGSEYNCFKFSNKILLENTSVKNIYNKVDTALTRVSEKNIMNESYYVLQTEYSDANILEGNNKNIYLGRGLRNIISKNCENIGFSINNDNFTYYGSFNGNTFLQNSKNITGFMLNNTIIGQNSEYLSIKEFNSVFLNTFKNSAFSSNTYNNIYIPYTNHNGGNYYSYSSETNFKAYVIKDDLGQLWSPYTTLSGSTLNTIRFNKD